MSVFPSQAITPAIFFVLSLASGLWLFRLGRPCPVVVVTIHKLLSLAAVVFTGVAVYDLSRAGDPGALEVGAIAATGLLFVLLFASGAVLSNNKPARPILSITHKVAPLLALLAWAATIFLLAGGNQ